MAQWRPTSTNWAEGRHLKSDAPSASRTRSVPSIVAQCAISFFHIITDLRDLRVELQFHFPRRPVALFGDDQFRKPEPAGSAERRGGKECVHTCRSRWSPVHEKTKRIQSL